MRLRGLISLAAAAAFVLAPSGATGATANPQLLGTVGPGYEIRLTQPNGTAVTQIDPGTYDIVVRDLSNEHNFHLTGPAVNETTGVEQQGTVTWTVTLGEGRYTYVCDPHSSDMRASFVVGNPPPPPSPPPPAAAAPTLLATVGPTNVISLRSASGAVLKSVKRGAYSIVVRDRSKVHNFHLVGPGVNRKSGIAATGTLTWKVTLGAGTLRFFSDRTPAKVRGSIRVT